MYAQARQPSREGQNTPLPLPTKTIPNVPKLSLKNLTKKQARGTVYFFLLTSQGWNVPVYVSMLARFC